MMFLVVWTPRKTVGPVSLKIGGHKRTTGEAGITTARGGFEYLGYFGNWIVFTVEIGDSR